MKRLLTLVLIGIVGYAFFLLLYLPAIMALNWYGPLPGGLQAYGVRGTLFDGQADALIGPDLRLDQYTWRIAPGELLAGRLGYHLSFTNLNNSGNGIVSRGLNGTAHFSPLELQADLKALSRHWAFAKRFGGKLSLQLQSLTLDKGHIVDARGGIAWSGAHLRGDRPIPLGGFQARLDGSSEQDDGFTGPIGDNGGPLSVTGRLQLKPDGHWTLKGKLALRNPANTDLGPLPASLGRPGSDGKIAFEWSGQLPPALLLPSPTPE